MASTGCGQAQEKAASVSGGRLALSQFRFYGFGVAGGVGVGGVGVPPWLPRGG